MKIEKKFYSPVEFGKLLGVSTRTVQRMCELKQIPHLRLGERTIRISPDEAIAAMSKPKTEKVDSYGTACSSR